PTRFRSIYEKNITLAVSRLVAAELKDRGYRVIMTRTRDTLIALSDRGRIANREKGDLFLSIHVNAANPGWNNAGSARGYETYFLAEARTEDARRVEQMENDAVRFETESEVTAGDPLSFIVTDMQQNEHLRESKELAAAVQDHLSRIHPGPNRGVKQAAFRVLVTAFMPSVLIALGFGTNAAERVSAGVGGARCGGAGPPEQKPPGSQQGCEAGGDQGTGNGVHAVRADRVGLWYECGRSPMAVGCSGARSDSDHRGECSRGVSGGIRVACERRAMSANSHNSLTKATKVNPQVDVAGTPSGSVVAGGAAAEAASPVGTTSERRNVAADASPP